MRLIPCLVFFLIASLQSLAQKNNFLYIQTENKQPFSLRMNGKIYSSTEMGYLIIPKLVSGDYPITIDFPKNIYPSQQFDVHLDHQDLGFVLKNVDSNAWVLQHLQSNRRIDSKFKDTEQNFASKMESDDFTKTLSQITNTPMPEDKKIIALNITKEQENTQLLDTVQSHGVLEENSITSKKSTVQTSAQLIDTVQASEDIGVRKERSDISLIFSTIDTSGQSLIYAVSQLGIIDTVVAFIPADNEPTLSAIITNTKTEVNITDSSSALTIKDTLASRAEKNTIAFQCNKVAEEKDFLLLRKKMASQQHEADMLLQAKKAFQSKCFSTQQVRNLSGLFLEEDKKLEFLIMSRTKIIDFENFDSLISLLSDESNIIKFKEVIQ